MPTTRSHCICALSGPPRSVTTALMKRDAMEFSRSGDSSLFGKLDKPITVNVSEQTHEFLQAAATHGGVPLSEYIRAVLESHVWGTAEILARSSQRHLPVGIRRITGQSQ